jgi:hypothetical protein
MQTAHESGNLTCPEPRPEFTGQVRHMLQVNVQRLPFRSVGAEAVRKEHGRHCIALHDCGCLRRVGKPQAIGGSQQEPGAFNCYTAVRGGGKARTDSKAAPEESPFD